MHVTKMGAGDTEDLSTRPANLLFTLLYDYSWKTLTYKDLKVQLLLFLWTGLNQL